MPNASSAICIAASRSSAKRRPTVSSFPRWTAWTTSRRCRTVWVTAKPIEKLLGITAPPRAQYIRVIMTELNRITSHLLWLGTHAIDLGAITTFLYCFREREEILKIFENYCGARLTTHMFRIGGTQYELYEGFQDQVRTFINDFPEQGRRIRNPAHRKPHLAGSHEERRHHLRQGRDRSGSDRAEPARFRCSVGFAQGEALLRLLRISISIFPSVKSAIPTIAIWCAWKKCGNRRESSSRPSKRFRMDRSWPRCPRSSSRRSAISTIRLNRRKGNWATTSSATAARWRIARVCGRRRIVNLQSLRKMVHRTHGRGRRRGHRDAGHCAGRDRPVEELWIF